MSTDFKPFVATISLRKRFMTAEMLAYISQELFDNTLQFSQSSELNDDNKVIPHQIEHYYWYTPLELVDEENPSLNTLQVMQNKNIEEVTGVLHFIIKDYIDLKTERYIIRRFSLRVTLFKVGDNRYKTRANNYLLLDE